MQEKHNGRYIFLSLFFQIVGGFIKSFDKQANNNNNKKKNQKKT